LRTLGRSACFHYDSSRTDLREDAMDFRAALDAIEGGSRVRREAWHNGRRWIARQEKDGFAAYVMALAQDDQTIERSEERMVGTECVSTWRSRWSQYPQK